MIDKDGDGTMNDEFKETFAAKHVVVAAELEAVRARWADVVVEEPALGSGGSSATVPLVAVKAAKSRKQRRKAAAAAEAATAAAEAEKQLRDLRLVAAEAAARDGEIGGSTGRPSAALLLAGARAREMAVRARAACEAAMRDARRP